MLSPSSIEKPLEWFESLILIEDLTPLQEEFKSYAKAQGGYFMPAHPYTGLNDESIFFTDIEANNEMNMVGHSFGNYWSNRFSNEYGLAILNLDKKIAELQKEVEKQSYLDMHLTLISSFQEIAQKKNIFKQEISLHNVLNNLKEYVQRKVDIQEVDHQDQLNDTFSNIFGFKKGTRSIRILYNDLVEVGFFDYGIDQLELFMNIFTLQSDTAGNSKLKVACSVEKAAYIFRRLEPLFYNLNYRNIEKQNVFVNNLNRPFKESGLSKGLLKFKEKIRIDPELPSDIDNMISRFV
ncbi:MAG: hypothetical protein WDN26_03655 [Chitinophagaceae bacterium]